MKVATRSLRGWGTLFTGVSFSAVERFLAAAASAVLLAGFGSVAAAAADRGVDAGTQRAAVTPTLPALPTLTLRRVPVTTWDQLTAAVGSALPGDEIDLADGTYTGKTSVGGISAVLSADRSGTSLAPIVVQGSSRAVLTSADVSKLYGVHLAGVSDWRLTGFTIRNVAKGVVLDRSTHVVLDGLHVERIGEEGVHLRAASHDNVVTGCTVTRTGLRKPQYGEGLYVGSAKSNWGTYSGGQPDASDHNQLLGNTISLTGAESIDVKEGTTGGTIRDNRFDGKGMSGKNYADSLVDMKGNGWTVESNTGANALRDGMQVHEPVAGWGQGNVFRHNVLDVRARGYGFFFQHPGSTNTVACDNVVRAAASGLANQPCT